MQLSPEQRAERARHAVYGSVIVLAVIIALDGTDVGAGEVLGSVLGAAIATVFAELYADYLAATIREGRRPNAVERRERLRNAVFGLLAAILPAIFFLLATLELIDLTVAFEAAVWTGVGVVGFYAFFANRIAGAGVLKSLAIGLAFTLLGTIVVLVKALASH